MDKYGYKLANNPLLLIFYKKVTGREVLKDLTSIVTKNSNIVDKIKKGKKPEKIFSELTDEEIDSIDSDFITEVVFNLFYACRCAYEKSELVYYETLSELKIEHTLDEKFINDLIEFVYGNLKKKK